MSNIAVSLFVLSYTVYRSKSPVYSSSVDVYEDGQEPEAGRWKLEAESRKPRAEKRKQRGNSRAGIHVLMPMYCFVFTVSFIFTRICLQHKLALDGFGQCLC
jgi:hypothetical protein